MKQVTVIYRKRTEPSKTLVSNNLQWYDPIKQEMFYFDGGQLEFEYREDEYLIKMGASERQKRGIRSTFRLLPKITDLQITSTKRCLYYIPTHL